MNCSRWGILNWLFSDWTNFGDIFPPFCAAYYSEMEMWFESAFGLTLGASGGRIIEDPDLGDDCLVMRTGSAHVCGMGGSAGCAAFAVPGQLPGRLQVSRRFYCYCYRPRQQTWRTFAVWELSVSNLFHFFAFSSTREVHPADQVPFKVSCFPSTTSGIELARLNRQLVLAA